VNGAVWGGGRGERNRERARETGPKRLPVFATCGAPTVDRMVRARPSARKGEGRRSGHRAGPKPPERRRTQKRGQKRPLGVRGLIGGSSITPSPLHPSHHHHYFIITQSPTPHQSLLYAHTSLNTLMQSPLHNHIVQSPPNHHLCIITNIITTT
jgi:hypothetical protein